MTPQVEVRAAEPIAAGPAKQGRIGKGGMRRHVAYRNQGAAVVQPMDAGGAAARRLGHAINGIPVGEGAGV